MAKRIPKRIIIMALGMGVALGTGLAFLFGNMMRGKEE